ncbi:MAG: prolyl oligopeptidase family serine peptidase [Planctomycetota bacterium]
MSAVSKAWRGTVVAVLMLAGIAAQAGRHELGLRLRAYERLLAKTEDASRRDAAFGEFERAVQAFFRLDMKTVAARIDAADRSLLGGEFAPAKLWARSVQLGLRARLVDGAKATLPFKLTQFFRPEDERAEVFEPDGVVLSVWLHEGADEQRFDVAELPFEAELKLAGAPAGDHALRWRLQTEDGKALYERVQGLSVVANRDARFAAIERAAKAAKAAVKSTIESESLVFVSNLLRVMKRRTPHETLLPGSELLAEAERLAAACASEQQVYQVARAGSFHLRVPVGRGALPTRLFAPPLPASISSLKAAEQAGERRPLVVALHGAGGSENLFFDGYGDGMAVAMCRERGWYCASPRNGMGGVDVVGLIDALVARYPIDTDRVFVVGHSMGAAAAMGSVARTPGRFRAVAPVSGGGRVRRSDAFAKVPFFVAAGGRDFGRAGSLRLRKAMESAGAKVEWRDYPAAEHFGVMQLSLPDVFAFFDKHAR